MKNYTGKLSTEPILLLAASPIDDESVRIAKEWVDENKERIKDVRVGIFRNRGYVGVIGILV